MSGGGASPGKPVSGFAAMRNGKNAPRNGTENGEELEAIDRVKHLGHLTHVTQRPNAAQGAERSAYEASEVAADVPQSRVDRYE